MSCPRCNVEWCFICRRKTPEYHSHFNSLFGCYGMQSNCGNYFFLILIILLLRLVVMPIIVFIVMLERIMRYTWICFRPCLKLQSEDHHDGNGFLMALLIGLIVMPIMILITIVVCIPVMTWQVISILYSFSCRYIFCCCC